MTLAIWPILLAPAAIACGFGVFVLLLRRDYPQYLQRALREWGIACFCFAGMFALVMEEGRIVLPHLSMLVSVLGRTLGAVGFGFQYSAITTLKKQKWSMAWMIAPPVVLFAGLLVIAFGRQSDTALMMAVSNLVYSISMARNAVSLAESEYGERPLPDKLTALAFGALCVISIVAVPADIRTGLFSPHQAVSSLRSVYGIVGSLGGQAVLLALFLLTISNRIRSDITFQALRDSLTGLYNRRAFEEIGIHEVSRADRTGIRMSLFMVNIDQFKKLNADFGPKIGDVILKAAAGAVLRSVRAEDYVCRWGGDEFCALLARATREDSEKVAERTLAAFRALDISVNGERIQVTISIGVVTRENSKQDFPDLVKQARAALHEAKKGGRNRHSVA